MQRRFNPLEADARWQAVWDEKQSFRAAKIINSLLNFSRSSGTEFERVDVNKALVDVLSRPVAGTPAVLLVEDLHWADPTTLEPQIPPAKSALVVHAGHERTARHNDLGNRARSGFG